MCRLHYETETPLWTSWSAIAHIPRCLEGALSLTLYFMLPDYEYSLRNPKAVAGCIEVADFGRRRRYRGASC